MPVPQNKAALERDLLRDRAYATLRDAIVDGTLAPGERLRDQELCEWLGLSRTPVREALSRLEQDGLVETEPQRFTRVAPLDRRAARDAFPIVAALHALAAELGVPRLTAADLEAMSNANAHFAAALKAADVDAALAADDAFHAVLLTASANAELTGVLDRLMPRLRRLERLRFGSLAGRGVGAPARRDHRRRGGQRRQDDRRASPGELALARDTDRPELRMTAIAPPDIHDSRTLAAARALLDAAADPQQMQREVLAAVARNEQWRGNECINLLAPEALMSPTVRQLLSAEVGQRAAEGHIGPVNRWFAGTKHIDEIEALCVELLKRLFKANYAEHRLVASMIGNMAVYAALTEPGDTVMTIPQPVGGHSSNRHDGPAGIRGLNIVDVPFDAEELEVDLDAFATVGSAKRARS